MKYVILILSIALSILIFINYTSMKKYENLIKIKKESGFITKKTGENEKMENPNKGIDYSNVKLEKIYLAGGCFWGVEEYASRIYGVADTVSGYANGNTSNPTYENLRNTGHAETVEVSYDASKVSLREIIKRYLKIIDPTSVNRQGNDVGTQYRTGIYYVDESQREEIKSILDEEQKKYTKKIVVELEPLRDFTKAEDYHQNYLVNNPNGYCHIDLDKAYEPYIDDEKYQKRSEEEIEKNLNPIQFEVTQKNGTESPFSNEYWDNEAKGIYVDVVTGEPLFVSTDKFNSNCGWPSFSKPIEKDVVRYKQDTSHNMDRTEVRSRVGDSHLGDVFDDGPSELGGLRYCINSAALRFIALEDMDKEGYGEFKYLVK